MRGKCHGTIELESFAGRDIDRAPGEFLSPRRPALFLIASNATTRTRAIRDCIPQPVCPMPPPLICRRYQRLAVQQLAQPNRLDRPLRCFRTFRLFERAHWHLRVPWVPFGKQAQISASERLLARCVQAPRRDIFQSVNFHVIHRQPKLHREGVRRQRRGAGAHPRWHRLLRLQRRRSHAWHIQRRRVLWLRVFGSGFRRKVIIYRQPPASRFSSTHNI
jgi:hypothetical protein